MAKKLLKKPTKKPVKKPVKKNESVKTPKTIDLSKHISPLDDRLIVKIDSEERITAGGLIIPDTASISGNLKGKVVAVGRGHRDNKGKIHKLEVQVGDHVLLSEYSGDSLDVLGQKVKIIRESEVLGILEK